MGLLGMLNKKTGYSEENMKKSFDEILPAICSTAVCSIAVSLKVKSLYRLKTIASGFACITNTNLLILYTIMPIKSAAFFEFNTSKKLLIKNYIAGQKIIEGKFYNVRSNEYDEIILQTAPKIDAFPNQEANLKRFLSILEPHIKG